MLNLTLWRDTSDPPVRWWSLSSSGTVGSLAFEDLSNLHTDERQDWCLSGNAALKACR